MAEIIPFDSTGCRTIDVPLGENVYRMRTYYLPYIRRWLLDITDTQDNPIILGICLNVGVANLVAGKAKEFDGQTIRCISLDGTANDTPDSLGNTCQVVYYGTDETPPSLFEDKMISTTINDQEPFVKLTLEEGTLTLKAGSYLTLQNLTLKKVTEDKSTTISTNDVWTVCASATNSSIGFITRKSKFGSGDTLPPDNTNYASFYNTTDGKIYHWSNSQWNVWNVSFPVCDVTVSGGKIVSIDKVYGKGNPWA